MKKNVFASVRAVIFMSVATLLFAFTQKENFFERVFTSIKSNLHQQIKSVTYPDKYQQSSTKALSFVEPGATCIGLASNAIGGNVWEDFNFDGDKSSETTIYGVSGIEVTIYNAANTAVGTQLTNADGNYLFSNLTEATYRVEFSIPAGMKAFTKGALAGTDSRTTVQFVAPGNCADLGVGNPAQYCDDNPLLVTPCYIGGEPSLGGNSAIGDVLVSYPFAANATKADVTPLSLNRDIGSTWGIAYARTSQDIYAASMMKRHAGFGPLGIGGVYRINHADPNNPVIEQWLDLAAAGVNVGVNPRNYALPAGSETASTDPEGFDAVGKIGLGDIDISEDEKTLYVINLNNNGSLVTIDIATKAVTQNIAIPNPGCGVADDVRPWGVTVYKGDVYVGSVCSGQTAGGGDMQFFVQKYDGNAFTTILNEPLDYDKGFVHLNYNVPDAPVLCRNWETWTTDFDGIHTAKSSKDGPRWCRPQPILSDIEFDLDGSMVLAFMDRTGHQTGFRQATTDDITDLGNGYTGGDILRAYNNAGTYVLESGGTTLGGGGFGLNNLPGSVDADTVRQGPGGGEYYNGEKFSNVHQETSLGGMALSPRHNNVALNVMDPTNFYTGGTVWLNNTSGEAERVFELYGSNPNLTENPAPGTFGKAAGLGDLELTCASAPLEIGNYVWNDANADGIQNPNEAGIDGITVELIKNGVKIATTTTQNGGQYYFTADGTPNQVWETAGDKVLPEMEYCIQIALSETALNDATPTLADADNSINGDARDNDAKEINGYAKITMTTGTAGTTDHDNDFGFTSNLCLGDYVWLDKNADGIQDANESGIAGLSVELLKNNSIVALTTTNAAGQYFFTVAGAPNQSWVTAGDKVEANMAYTIRIATNQASLATHKITELDATNDLLDNDAVINGDYAVINVTSGLAGSSDHHYDFGFQPTLSVGNLVWMDSNNNGIAESTEAGIAGVEVILYQVGADGIKDVDNDTEIARQTTDGQGNYLFSNLAEGIYYIKVNDGIPTNLASANGTGANGLGASTYEPAVAASTDIDNDDNGTQMGTMVMTDTFTLKSCTEPITDGDTDSNTNLSIDIAFIPCLSIGNLVFNDADNNGVFDNGEAGLGNITVELYQLGDNGIKGDADDKLIESTTTNSSGNYLFDELKPGNYYVKLNGGIPTGMVSSTGQGPVLVLGNGSTEPAADPENNVDNTDDGTQMGTMVMSGVVNLGLDGEPTNDGDTDNLTNLTIDFGLYGSQCLGDYVWLDKNSDGIQDDDESGIAGITVELLKNNDLVATTTTNADGQYFFTTDGASGQTWVTAGDEVQANMDYIIRIATTQNNLANHELTGDNATSDLLDNDAVISGDYAIINVTSGILGSNDHHYDFGFQPTLSVGNLVWLDNNNNGIAEATETGIPNVEVILYQVGGDGTKGIGNDTEVDKQTTDSDGKYLFSNLEEGVYFIKINDGPANLVSSTGTGINGLAASAYEPAVSTSSDIDNDDNGTQMGTMVMTDTFTLKSCTEPITDGDNDSNTNLSVDIAFIPCLAVGNLVFEDVDNDGTYNGSEPTLAGVEVQLYNAGADGQKGNDDELLATQVTKADGLYLFDGLKPGNYYVKLNSGIPANMVSSTGSGAANASGQGPNEPAPNPDNNDANNDDNGTQMGTMVMSDLFNLGIGTEPTNDGDADPNTNLSIDFGLIQLMSLGNLVWSDINNNGVVDGKEAGIEGVEAILYQLGPDGQKATADDVEINRDITDANGNYLFTQLTAGDYYVKLADGIPFGFGSSTGEGIMDVDGVGDYEVAPSPNNDIDNDDNGNQMNYMIMSDVVTLALNSEPINDGDKDNQSNLTVDFGLFQLLRLGNLVWEDYDNDGTRDADEPGIEGVEAILYQVGPDGVKATADDVEISRDITDADGHYIFVQLLPGEYYVKLNSGIDGFNSSTGEGQSLVSGAGSFETAPDPDNDVDNEDNGTQMGSMVMSDLIMLEFMQEPAFEDNFVNSNFTLDFGLFQPLAIGNLVWNDINNDGLVSPNEPGFSGVEVILYHVGPDGQKSTDDIEINRMITDANGNYNFSNLKPGNYYVKLNNVSAQYESSNGLGLGQLGGNGPYEPGIATNNDINADDNGSQMGNMVMSDIVTLELYSEPINDGDADRKTNLSVDFGLLKVNEIYIHNPCTCLNNESSPNAGDGQFTERITILSSTRLADWTVSAVNGAFDANNAPVTVGALATENGSENGQHRYTFDVKHVDGVGYSISFTNGEDVLSVNNLCHYEHSCHFTAPPTTCTDCTPGQPVADPCVMTFIMGTDGTARRDSLNCCDSKSTFVDDGTVDGLYKDNAVRNDLFTICPETQWQILTYNFSQFELEAGDTLYVYDGENVSAPLLGKFSGTGISKTGGWVASNCNPRINPTGCLTFRFVTDGDNNKGAGWNGNFECAERDIKLSANLLPSTLTCTETTKAYTIKPATLTAGCGTVVDSQIVRIFNAHGELCKDTCLASDKDFTEVFAIGSYKVEYKLKTDTVKTTTASFDIQGTAPVCNDVVRIPLGSACSILITPDDLLEGPCDTITDTVYYVISILGIDDKGKETVVATGGGKGGNYPELTKAQFDSFGGKLTAVIEKQYYSGLTLNICNNGAKSLSCRTTIEIEDSSVPVFGGTTRDTFKVCDIDLSEEALGLTKPEAYDNCGAVNVTFTSVNVLTDGGVCDTTRAEVIWTAADGNGNTATLAQQIVFIRSDANDIVKPADKTLSCGVDTEATFNDLEKVGVPGIKVGKIKNGVLIPTDTIDLSTEKYVCGFILQQKDIVVDANCGKKLYRTWDILDWCDPTSGPTELDVQFINLLDITPPTFTAGVDALPFKTVDLGHFDCTYDLTKLEKPAATDNCSSVSVRLDKVFRIEDGKTWEVPTAELTALNCDSFRIQWVAEDDCHEQLINDTLTQDILIQDVTKPSAICVDGINVSIGTEDIKMHYSAFDGGSYDACGIEKIEVSRDQRDWYEYMIFGCRDIHRDPTIYLRVTDKKGNQNICWMTVNVEDKIAPICSDLPDRTGTCDKQHAEELGTTTDTNGDGKMSEDEWVDLTGDLAFFYDAKYGNPRCSDNVGACGPLTIRQQYQLISWPCGIVDIKRRYRAIDWDGEGNKSDWKVQNIKIEYKADWSITFPADWKGSCGADIPASAPIITNGACDLLAVEMEEKTFVTDEEACLKVVRTFTVINWCKFEAGHDGMTIRRVENEHGMVKDAVTITAEGNEEAGKIIYTQVLKVTDNEAPVVTIQSPDNCINAVDGDAAPYGVEDLTPGTTPYECDELKTWTATAEDCAGSENITWKSRIYENGQLVKEGTSNSISYVVQNKQTYKAEFWAYDGCGNSGGAETEAAKFWDCKKPTPYCIHGVAVELMNTGMVQIWATDVDRASYDNCTSADRLTKKIWHKSLGDAPTSLEAVKALPEVITLNCAYVGQQDISLYVIDEEDNWDFCVTYVIVQDNMNACSSFEGQAGLAKVEGTIMDWKGNTVEEVQVAISNSSSMMTLENGVYTFELPMNESYSIEPSKDNQPLNGVSTFDLVLISKHILGINKFTNPHQHIAADVNQSGSITAFDMVQLRRLILNIETDFVNNTSWKFVEAAYQFTSNNPAAEDFPTLATVANLEHSMQMDFTAIKIGDVNGNARTNSLQQVESRNTTKAFEINIPEMELKAGQTYTVAFTTKQLAEIEGYQFTLGTGNLQFQQLNNGITGIENFGLNKIEKGYITTSWNGNVANAVGSQELFTIEFTAMTNGKLSNQLGLTARPTAIEAYSTTGELLDVTLNFTNTNDLTNSLELYQNKPNPFKGETNISFFLPESSEVTLTLRDEMGRLLKEIKAYKAAGQNNLTISGADLPAGMIYYQLNSKYGTQTKKMLRIE